MFVNEFLGTQHGRRMIKAYGETRPSVTLRLLAFIEPRDHTYCLGLNFNISKVGYLD